jgi:hypothetical protein
LIGIVNAEDELTTMLFGKEVAEQGGTDTADVQITGKTRSKTSADCHGGYYTIKKTVHRAAFV